MSNMHIAQHPPQITQTRGRQNRAIGGANGKGKSKMLYCLESRKNKIHRIEQTFVLCRRRSGQSNPNTVQYITAHGNKHKQQHYIDNDRFTKSKSLQSKSTKSAIKFHSLNHSTVRIGIEQFRPILSSPPSSS